MSHVISHEIITSKHRLFEMYRLDFDLDIFRFRYIYIYIYIYIKLNKTSTKTNVATDEANSRNEM